MMGGWRWMRVPLAVVVVLVTGAVFLAGPGVVSQAAEGTPYTLTYDAGAGGSINGDTPQIVLEGNDGTQVTAVPNTGYRFVSWSDGLETASRTDTTVMADLTVSASFALKSYALTYTPGAGGTITGDTSQTVLHGDDGTTVTAVPNTGYRFVSWSDGITTAGRTDTNVTAAVTATANFALKSYALTYTPGAGGTITGDTSQTVLHGDDGTTVTAVPNTGYRFVSWSDGITTASRTDTNVTAAVTATANFALKAYTLTYTAGTGGTITGDTSQTVQHGDDATQVTAVPSTGYRFVSWSDGITTASRTDTNVTAAITVSANFALQSYALTYTPGTGGTITGDVSQSVQHGGDGTQVTAVPNAGYRFVSWSDGLTTASRTDTNVTAAVAVTASFIKTYTLTYTPGAGGTITGVTSQTVDEGASGTAVTAVPNTGYHFVSWSDGITTASRTHTNVTAAVAVTANFAINTFTITPTAGLHGAISPAGLQTVNYGTSKAFTITPSYGYYVASVLVDGASVGPVRTYTFTNVTASHTIAASFVAGVQTTAEVSSAKTLMDYGGSTLLTGWLYDSRDPLKDVGMGGQPVTVQSAPTSSGPWSNLATLTTSSAVGSVGKCSLLVTPKSPTYYRLRFVAGEESGYGSALSATVLVNLRPVLGTPQVPLTVGAGRTFTVYGSLKPHFPVGQKTVWVKMYRYKYGRYTYLRKIQATNVDSGSITKYSVPFKVTTRGTYRFRADTAAWADDSSVMSRTLTVK